MAGQGGGLFGTHDGGRHWSALNAGLSSENVSSFAVDPADSSILYAGLDHGVFKSLQAGATWADSSIYDRSVYALLQPASGQGVFYAGTNSGVYTSADDGSVWTSLGLGNHTVAALLGQGTTLLAATEAGVYRLSGAGQTWKPTLRIPALALAQDPNLPGSGVLAGTGAGLFRSADGGLTWQRLAAGTAMFAAILTQGQTIFAAGAAGLVVSADDGATFTRHSVNNETVRQLLAVPESTDQPAVLYARTDAGRLYQSTTAGRSWIDTSVGALPVSSLTLGNNGRLYAATNTGIYTADARASSWILTDQRLAGPQPVVLQAALGGSGAQLLAGLDGQGVIESTPHFTPISPLAAAFSPGAGQYFPQTGHFVRAPFLDWYNANNGQTLFGQPRTEALQENGHMVQFFQNAVLVYDPALAGTPQVIGLEPLGTQLAAYSARSIAPFDNTTTRRYFPQTGHSLSGEFLSFWRAFGGVTLFGYPIGEPRLHDHQIVQDFQNVRLVADPTVGMQFFNTRLAPLGDDLLKQKGWL